MISLYPPGGYSWRVLAEMGKTLQTCTLLLGTETAERATEAAQRSSNEEITNCAQFLRTSDSQ